MDYLLIILAFSATLIGVFKDIFGERYRFVIAGCAIVAALLTLAIGLQQLFESKSEKESLTEQRRSVSQKLDLSNANLKKVNSKNMELSKQLEISGERQISMSERLNASKERIDELNRQNSLLSQKLDELRKHNGILENKVQEMRTTIDNDVHLRKCREIFEPIKHLRSAAHALAHSKVFKGSFCPGMPDGIYAMYKESYVEYKKIVLKMLKKNPRYKAYLDEMIAMQTLSSGLGRCIYSEEQDRAFKQGGVQQVYEHLLVTMQRFDEAECGMSWDEVHKRGFIPVLK